MHSNKQYVSDCLSLTGGGLAPFMKARPAWSMGGARRTQPTQKITETYLKRARH